MTFVDTFTHYLLLLMYFRARLDEPPRWKTVESIGSSWQSNERRNLLYKSGNISAKPQQTNTAQFVPLQSSTLPCRSEVLYLLRGDAIIAKDVGPWKHNKQWSCISNVQKYGVVRVWHTRDYLLGPSKKKLPPDVRDDLMRGIWQGTSLDVACLGGSSIETTLYVWLPVRQDGWLFIPCGIGSTSHFSTMNMNWIQAILAWPHQLTRGWASRLFVAKRLGCIHLRCSSMDISSAIFRLDWFIGRTVYTWTISHFLHFT